MNRIKQQESSSVIRWALIILGAVIIGGVIVGALSQRFFPTGPTVPGPATGEQAAKIAKKWEFTESGPIVAALALGDDGTLYAASEDGFLYALDASGKLQWKFNAGPMVASPVLGADATVYVINEDQLITAINRAGTQRWANGGGPYADKQMGSITSAIDQNHLYTPWRGLFRAIRLADGGFDWPSGYGFQRGGSISILPNGLVVYSEVGRVNAADSTGRIQWQFPVMNPVTPDVIARNRGHVPIGNFWLDSAIAVGDDGSMYLCARDSRLVALTADGRFKWEFNTNTHFENRASPVIALDGTIYFASGNRSLYALRPDGTQKWELDTGGPISVTPVLAEDETVYVLGGSTLLAVSPEGKLLEKAAVGEGVEGSPTLAADGTLYIGGRDGKIVAFAGTHGGLLKSPWPKFQATLANSGRAHPF
jgi:outer membrane protein assembly factor BamB